MGKAPRWQSGGNLYNSLGNANGSPKSHHIGVTHKHTVAPCDVTKRLAMKTELQNKMLDVGR